MQFWFARAGGVPLREQLVTQIILGILCGELAAEHRLPSTRELARRYRIHPNTVSSAYRKLEQDRWVESRRGSGVYVCGRTPDNSPSDTGTLDRLIGNLFRAARELGLQPADVRSRLIEWLAFEPPDHFLVVEPDDELRRILVAEIEQATAFPVKGTGLEQCADQLTSAVAISMPAAAAEVRRVLPPGTEHVVLQLRSATAMLAPWLPVRVDALVAVASRSQRFLKSAHTMLLAAGLREEALLIRHTRRPDWRKGLTETAAVVCDFLTASAVPKACRKIVFPLLSEASLAELRAIQQATTAPRL